MIIWKRICFSYFINLLYVHFWNIPLLCGHPIYICKIESIQHHATKLVPDIRHLSYLDRLKALGLRTLEYRRDHYDRIQVYKALHGIDDIEWQNMFNLSNNPTIGHTWKIIKEEMHYNTTFAYFFHQSS